MGLELFIDGKKCDLLPDEAIPMSYSNNVIGEAIQPSGNASKQFTLPKTQQNTEIFEVADSINSDTDIPYRKLPVRLLQNGRELISDGFAIIEQSSKSYQVVVYGGNLDFFEEIKGKNIRDLTSLSQFDHIWNFVNVATSRQFTEGYIYPIIDWNSDGAFMDNLTSRVDPRFLFHAMFDHTIIKAIFSEAGFNIEGPIIDDPRYKSILTPVIDNIVSDEFKDDRKTIARKDPAGGIIHTTIASQSVLDDPIDLDDTSLGDVYTFWTQKTFTVNPNVQHLTFGYTSELSGRYSVRLTASNMVTSDAVQPAFIEIWQVKPSGLKIKWIRQEITVVPDSIDETTEIKLEQGDAVLIAINSGGIQIPATTIVSVTDPQVTIIPLTNRNIYNTKISAVDNLPNMTQTEFIKSMAKQFGIIFSTNSFTKTVQFRQFKDIYDNILNAKIWTDKLDSNSTNKQHILKYHPEGYAQVNILKWSNDVSPTLDEDLGEGRIVINDASLDNEKDLIVMPFSATEMSKRLINLDVPVIRFLKLGVPIRAMRPRKLILEKSSDVTIEYNDTTISGFAGNNIPLCYFQLEGKTFNLGFDDSLIDDSYNEFSFFLDKFKELTAYYNLNENDISDLDFFIPIYDDFFKHYFFISKIDNFIAGTSTRCKLIRL